ncbi:hypothetical protein ACHAWO_006443 [Cyclotella atomus]|uniref:Pescadillo homolog n=1 Tax=Cyclotella atomus TaxID=382360 RepID=A0ABD3NUT1_9STRA
MGNRVKGRPKPKSIKAAIHSGMATHRKLSRYGKKQKKGLAGANAVFIARSKVLKKLGISLKDFRRLCILKGVYPREPRSGSKKNSKQVHYHIKDVKALSHEPLLDKFREFRAFMKKVRRAANRNEKDEARRREALAPRYTLHHLVRERYPRFVDALNDLDDALCLISLFAALPSEGRVKAGVTRKAKELISAWGAYCSVGGRISKSFVSVKGIYLEASIQTPSTNGESVTIRWVQPHNFTQYIPDGVDFRVMLTFFEFYETLLGFVLFKLYGELGIRYPLVTATSGAEGDGKVANNPSLHPTIGGKATSVLAANLNALQVSMHQAQQGNSAADAIGDALQKTATEEENDENAKDKKSTKAERKKQKKLMLSIDEALKGVKYDDDDSANGDDDEEMDEEDNVPIAAPLREALEAISDNNGNNTSDNDTEFVITDPEAQRRHQLFRNLTFFLSREVPRGYLELIILSFGGQVGWEGQDSPIAMDDPSITHHVVDRPALLPAYSKLPKSRDYIQPQWVMDSANFNFCLPIDKYGVGKTLPPHLSPWVDDKEEGYVPKYKEEIERLKNGEVLTNEDDVGAGGVVLKVSESEQVENVSASDEEEVQPQVDDDVEKGSSDESDSSEGEEEDDEEVETKAAKKTQAEDDEAAKLAKALMSKKAARLYDRMQHGKAQQQAKVDNLHKKRREIESTREKSKDGLTVTKQKVLRLKKERKDVEDSYGEGVGGGSMKKKKRRKN